jgi:putative transcriptional regulator
MSDSLRGKFLIAGRALRDPNFYQTVVLIVGHGAEGAMGVVVNRPSELTVAQALEKDFDLPETGELVHVGGPVDRNALFVLHDAADFNGGETPIIDGLYVGNSPETFEQVVQQAALSEPPLRFRVYFGCAGWAPDQLEGELNRNDWLLLPATLDYVFHPEPYSVWELALCEYRKMNPLVPGFGGSPDLN